MGSLLLVACGAVGGSPSPAAESPDGPPAAGPLAGTSWRLLTIGGSAPPADVNVTLELTADQASGRSGCNQYSGSYTVEGAGISFGPLAVTEMACPEPQMGVEAAYMAALAAATTWAIPADAPVGAELTLSGSDPAQTLVFGPGG
jgi:heat shock protein HslJ